MVPLFSGFDPTMERNRKISHSLIYVSTDGYGANTLTADDSLGVSGTLFVISSTCFHVTLEKSSNTTLTDSIIVLRAELKILYTWLIREFFVRNIHEICHADHK